MMRRPGVAIVLAVGLLLAGVASTSGPVTATPEPADPPRDVLGWEAGYWYNESISVDRGDGLNETELDKVVGRAMARVERVRGLEFKHTVPVSIINRSAYLNRTERAFANVSTNDRLHQNVKYESLLMVGEHTDAISLLKGNRGSSVLGFYSVARDEIVIVSDNPDSLELDEITLAQELYHALQDQHFDLAQFNRSTEERNNAINGIIEGDGNYVDFLYEQRCQTGSWGDCLQPQGTRGGGDLAHVGLYLIAIQPYTDGPTFVQHIRDRRGWSGVNAIYRDPPASTEQVIHPKKYKTDPPSTVTIEDRSSDTWRVLDLDEGINYAEFGEAGMFAMFLYPGIETNGRMEVIPLDGFFTNQDLDPYDYESRFSAGWDGDKLLPYVTNGSADTNETGYVWKSVWDSPAEAREFIEGYRLVLNHHDAERVAENTYVLPDDGAFGDAIHLNITGSTVVVVNAPTVEQLPAVHAGAAPPPSAVPDDDQTTVSPTGTDLTTASDPGEDPGASTPTSNPGSGQASTPAGGAETPAGSTGTASPGQPGFEIVTVLAAIITILAVLRRR